MATEGDPVDKAVDNGVNNLERFVRAQDHGGAYLAAVEELKSGRKRTHWMWFVFPQIAGLGRSETAIRYAISDLAEAKAYLSHPVLGARLIECVRIVAESPVPSAVELLGGIDAMKLRSSVTLFASADPDQPAFGAVLDRYFDGEPDAGTLDRL